MAHNPATELASAIQSVSIKHDPSPHHDINPSTAASKKIPATISSPDASDIDDDASDIPSDVIRPRPRQKSFPPLPDFRFEQSYLASIKNAKTNGQVMYITIRDQVILPLAQGMVWNLALFGWRYWNRGTKFTGQTFGARIRKWWWEVNNWKVPAEANMPGRGRAEFAKGAEDFYVDKFGSSVGD